jgi:outer membrane protein assembly factor BamB
MKKIFALAIFGILCLSIFSGFAQVSAQTTSSEWPQLHGDSGHTGYTTSNGPATNNLLWSYSTNPYGDIADSAAVANGYVYFSSYTTFYCLNATSGAKVWNFTTIIDDFSNPAVANGLVYVACDDGNLYCFNGQTGAVVWNLTCATGSGSDPVISNGYVYCSHLYTDVFGNNFGILSCFNATSGNEVWHYSVAMAYNTGRYGTTPTVANGCVYFIDGQGYIQCLNATNGNAIWSNPNSGYWMTAANGYLYYSVYGGALYCLNALTGAQVWNYTAGGTIYACPAVANGNVYFGCEDNNFYCLNAQTGALVWKYDVGNYIFTGSVSGNGYVYFGGNDYYIYCLNAQSGDLVWKYQTGRFVTSMPAIANGVLYCGSTDGIMYAFGISSSTNTQTPTLTLKSSTSSTSGGQQITLSGTISPSTSGTITLYASDDGTPYVPIGNATLSGGSYSYQYTIRQDGGNFNFRAEFAGNSQYNAAQSPIVAVSASIGTGTTTTSSGGFPWWIIVVVVVIIALALLALIWMRRR